jgi:cbb3-type cytochrome oxidase maturation protein
MNILYLLVPAAVLLAAIGVAAFAWAVRTGQFDDVDTPAVRAILDDAPGEDVTDPHPQRETDNLSTDSHG